ncbi:MAG TPA: zinc-ribbon domain-containing protein, partial [Spirochaetota bacterium]|nr:zinc-ribbon domain-containing protein [Spirochaetota bacterium]HPF08081.1 zinc-ribbon domain-containing protein [Spirochaetota bacterium]HPJ44293.1 zinc-ribbon domain-containing protein [Spirochaetota bacterium]HRX49058.1 zinc-ribbon domain-containing protein [Spirochaetota bacterium]
MIVRCTSCVSAFAVDDEKVANRKFAFTCPKCGTENIFDNRKQEEKPASGDLFFDEGKDEQDLQETSAKESTFEQDLGSEEAFFEEPAATPEKKSAKGINLEIEETLTSPEEEISFDDDFF